MAFTLSGSTITQSGTDTSLAGLNGIAGVTVTTVGSGVDLIRIVNLNNLKLIVDGNLTMNSDSPELLLFGETAPDKSLVINAGKVFTLGKRTTLNSTTRSEYRIGGIYFAKRYGFHFDGAAIDNYGTFNWYGDIAGRTLPMRNNTGSVTSVRDGFISVRETCGSNVQSLIFHSGGTINIDGLTLSGRVSFTRVNNGVVTSFLNVNTIQADSTNQNENSTSPFDIFGFNPSGNFIDLGWYLGQAQTRGIRSYNSPVGTNLYAGVADSATPEKGWVEMWKQINVRTQNPDNSPISNAIIYIKDVNNGNRGAVAGVTGAFNATTPTARNTGYLATDNIALGTDRLYIKQTTSGLTGNFDVLIGVVASQENVGRPGYDTGTSRIDRRGKTDIQGSRNNTDTFDIHTWSYGNLYTKISDYSMLGAGVGLPIATMLLDSNVTLSEANAITKLASSFTVSTSTNTITVTANSTLDDLYDVMKVYKTRNVQAQLEYPTISTQPVTANGDTLVTAMSVVGLEFLTAGVKFKKLQANGTANASFTNLTVNGNVSQATPTNLSGVTITGTLTYNTNTATAITITNTTIGTVANSGTGIVTIEGGTITTYTDAEINYLNSTATIHLPTGFDEFAIYASNADALNEVNPIFSGTAVNNIIKYKAELYGGATIYIRPKDNDIVGEVLIMPQVVPTGIGNYDFTVVSFSESTQLNTLIAQVANLTTITAKESTTAKTTELNSAVSSIKGADNKDITQVFNNTPTIDNAGVATAVRTELTPELAIIDTNLDKKVSEVGGGGGGYSVNLSGVTGSINNLSKLVRDESDAIKKHITAEHIETNSHINLAKGEINDTIESIEIPETIIEEKETKKAIKLIKEVDKKLTSYIESEMNEKEELSAINREFARLEMEDAKKEKEKEIEHKKMMEEKQKMEEEKRKLEEEEDAKLLEEIKAEFDKQEQDEMEEKRKELEKELEEKQKEAEEIKKELNSLK